MQLIAVADAATRDSARSLITEYLQWIAGEASRRYGLTFDIDAMVASDLDDRSKFFPPTGRFYVVRVDGHDVGIGCLKALTPQSAEIQRMYIQPHVRGVVSMARSSDPNSASSQFFIVVKDSNYLDGQYSAFGEVISGLEVADKIARGYDRLVTVLGADHHGYIPRVRNALEALGLPKERFEVELVQLVSLLRDGKPYKMGKRLGNLVTIEEIVEEIDAAAGRKGAGADALRYFYLAIIA